MNVNQIAETYSRLGRLGRNLFPQAESPETQTSKEQVEDQTRYDLPEPKPLVPSRIDSESKLTLSQAYELTLAGAEEIKAMDRPNLAGNLHDLSQISLIIPRYV